MCGGGPYGEPHTPACPSLDSAKAEELRETVREFESGANRSPVEHKVQYSRHLHPAVIRAYGEYMHEHRTNRRTGAVRDPDNWQMGITKQAYIDSLVRHVIDLWALHYGETVIDPDDPEGREFTVRGLCCAIMFNVMGYLYETLVEGGMKRGREK